MIQVWGVISLGLEEAWSSQHGLHKMDSSSISIFAGTSAVLSWVHRGFCSHSIAAASRTSGRDTALITLPSSPEWNSFSISLTADEDPPWGWFHRVPRMNSGDLRISSPYQVWNGCSGSRSLVNRRGNTHKTGKCSTRGTLSLSRARKETTAVSQSRHWALQACQHCRRVPPTQQRPPSRSIQPCEPGSRARVGSCPAGGQRSGSSSRGQRTPTGAGAECAPNDAAFPAVRRGRGTKRGRAAFRPSVPVPVPARGDARAVPAAASPAPSGAVASARASRHLGVLLPGSHPAHLSSSCLRITKFYRFLVSCATAWPHAEMQVRGGAFVLFPGG